MLEYEVFAKLVWILMIPATIIGMFVWLLTSNHREYQIKQDIQTYIRDLEGEHGLLWRYSPILSELKPDEFLCKGIMLASREKNFAKMSPEDYSQAVLNFYDLVRQSSKRRINPETAIELNQNLDQP